MVKFVCIQISAGRTYIMKMKKIIAGILALAVVGGTVSAYSGR